MKEKIKTEKHQNVDNIYFMLDGDDIGNQIEAKILENDLVSLSSISNCIKIALDSIEERIINNNGEVIFRGCDDVSGTLADHDYMTLLRSISQFFLEQTTFSASIGIGSNLHEAYLALRYVKCKQKGQVILWNHVVNNSKNVTIQS